MFIFLGRLSTNVALLGARDRSPTPCCFAARSGAVRADRRQPNLIEKLTQDSATNWMAGNNPAHLGGRGRMQPGNQQMDRADLHEGLGNQAGESDQVSCTRCASKLRLFSYILDPRDGKTFRLFRCRCGELVWVD